MRGRQLRWLWLLLKKPSLPNCTAETVFFNTFVAV